MIIGHMPASYIIARLVYPRLPPDRPGWKTFAATAALGAVFPDFDLFYYKLVDHGAISHHAYWTHFPVVWILLLSLAWGWLLWARRRGRAVLAFIFSLNGLAHMGLDSVVGRIRWLAPYGDEWFSLATVPPLYHPWWLNFILHWSFGIELAITAWALYLWRRPIAPASRAGAP